MRRSGFGCVLRTPTGLRRLSGPPPPAARSMRAKCVEERDRAVLRPRILRSAGATGVEDVEDAGRVGGRLRKLIEERDLKRAADEARRVGSGPGRLAVRAPGVAQIMVRELVAEREGEPRRRSRAPATAARIELDTGGMVPVGERSRAPLLGHDLAGGTRAHVSVISLVP